MKLNIAAAVLLVSAAASPSAAFSASRKQAAFVASPSHFNSYEVGRRRAPFQSRRFGTALQVSLQGQEVNLGSQSDEWRNNKAAQGILRNGDASPAPETKQAAAAYLAQYQGETGAAVVYSKLKQNGITVVNGYSGGAVLPLLDQFHQDHPRHNGDDEPIRWITNSNESSAGHVAEGIAKSTDGVGVLIATSGPGVTNIITPLQDAICDGVPLVALCGQAATFAPQDAFQSAPAVAMTSPCTKWSHQIRSAAELPFAMDYAFYLAKHGRPGPVFIDLPKDLQTQVITPELTQEFLDSISAQDNENGFARWVSRRHANGKIGAALHLGEADKGLSFDIAKDDEGKLKLSALAASNETDAFHQDHHPSDTIIQTQMLIDGKSKSVARKGDLRDSQLMTEMVEVIRSAKRPVIIAGQGCNDAPEELRTLAEALQIPVTTTLLGLGSFDERHPLALNMLGMHGHATPNFMIQESDLIICIGSRFDDRITGKIGDFVPEARKAAAEGRGGVIHVDIRLSEKAKQVKPTYFVHSTGKNFLQALNKQLATDASRETATRLWLKRKVELEKDFPVKIPKFPTQSIPVGDDNDIVVSRTRMSAQHVISELNAQLLAAGRMDDSIFSTGVGIHQMVAAQLLTWTQPRQMLSSGSLGTMGVALGYAIGAKLANGKKIVIAIDGDGSFNMTFTELKTVAEQKIPVKIMILDNESQMMVEYWQRLFHDGRYLAVRNSRNPEYTTLAKAFGIKNIYCDCEEDLPAKMNEFLFSDPEEPVLFHVRIERTPCLPMVAPGQALENMILEDEDFQVDKTAAPS